MYCMIARLSCLMLLAHADFRACSRALAKTGKRMAARMAMMAITTSSSIRVKPARADDARASLRCRTIMQDALGGAAPWPIEGRAIALFLRGSAAFLLIRSQPPNNLMHSVLRVV